jgi:hypothetical protein
VTIVTHVCGTDADGLESAVSRLQAAGSGICTHTHTTREKGEGRREKEEGKRRRSHRQTDPLTAQTIGALVVDTNASACRLSRDLAFGVDVATALAAHRLPKVEFCSPFSPLSSSREVTPPKQALAAGPVPATPSNVFGGIRALNIGVESFLPAVTGAGAKVCVCVSVSVSVRAAVAFSLT